MSIKVAILGKNDRLLYWQIVGLPTVVDPAAWLRLTLTLHNQLVEILERGEQDATKPDGEHKA